jgi:hypothetical protein
MKIIDKCPICRTAGEDGGHLFFKCRLAIEVWSHLYLDRERISLAATTLVRDAVDLILKSKEERRLLMVIAMWFTWHERNLIREEGCSRGAELLARCIKTYADESTPSLGREFRYSEQFAQAEGEMEQTAAGLSETEL